MAYFHPYKAYPNPPLTKGVCDWYFSIVGVVVLEKADVCLSDVPLLFQAYVSWFQVGVNSELHMGPCGQWRAVKRRGEEETTERWLWAEAHRNEEQGVCGEMLLAHHNWEAHILMVITNHS